QQNAALVEESAAAAESLKGQAQQLVQAVAVFKLAHSMHGSPGHAPLPTAVVAATPSWQGTERRGAERAKNVTRPQFGSKARPAAKPESAAPAAEAAPAKTGTDDWESF
ncbi:MAG: methyl-accepting chemotaxis protein, partial [Rubrivivax sp.]|nr:methyl-accepting chemotaxis protein [Rubrivivax sp.]